MEDDDIYEYIAGAIITTERDRPRVVFSHPGLVAPYGETTMYPLGERKAFGLDLLDTVTYFLRPCIVTRGAHFVGQTRAKASWERTMALAKAELGVP